MASFRTRIRFGTDGWRAAIAEDFTFDAVTRLSHGVARFNRGDSTRRNIIVVGYDRRFASEKFAAMASDVLSSYGLEVHLSDRAVPTQLCSFIARQFDCLAMVVTASHNQWQDNGIKIKDRMGAPAAQDVLTAIEDNIPAEAPDLDAAGRGRVLVENFTPLYTDRLRELVDADLLSMTPIRLVVDPMHGCGAGWLESLLTCGETVRLSAIRGNRDPYFGGVNPEPIPPNINALRDAVVAENADGGIAFDGDADRLGLVTESGRFVNQLQVFGLLYWHLLEDRRLIGPAVYTVSSTDMIPRLARAFGSSSYETPVGFKYVGPKMQEIDALIGGEESGGFGFGFHLPERDGLLAALMLLEMRAQREVSFDKLVDDLQANYGPSEYARIDVRYERHGYSEVVRRGLSAIEKDLDSAFEGPRLVSRVALSSKDGFKVRFEDSSWVLLRFSDTEPVLRIYSEAGSKARVQQLLEEGRALVK